MSAEALLSRLDAVRKTGSGTWRARCPSHDSRSLTLSIRELEDGRTLLRCFAGCEADEVVAAVGMGMADLMPPRALVLDRIGRERRPFPASDVLQCLAHEGMVVLVAGRTLLSGGEWSEADQQRLAVAVGRLNAGVDAAGERRG